MIKVVAEWSGWSGSPGFSNFYFGVAGIATATNALHVQTRVHDFFGAITLCIPTGVIINFHQDSQIIDPVTGDILDTLSAATPAAAVVGAGATQFSSLSGACVIWKTSTVINSRQLRGKTFLVPLASGVYDVGGGIVANRLSDMRSAAIALATPGAFPAIEQLVAWHRPVGGTGGSAATTNTASVANRAAFLTSRRP